MEGGVEDHIEDRESRKKANCGQISRGLDQGKDMDENMATGKAKDSR